MLPVVREAEKAIAADETLNHEYLPVLGMEAFTEVACKLVLGEQSPAITGGRVSCHQRLGDVFSSVTLVFLCDFSTLARNACLVPGR